MCSPMQEDKAASRLLGVLSACRPLVHPRQHVAEDPYAELLIDRKCLTYMWCHAGSGYISSGQQSDHLLMVAAFNAWEEAKAQVSPVP